MPNLVTKIQKANDFACLGSVTDDQISFAEKALHLTFSDDFKEYLRPFGTATFDGKELTGICPSDRLNVVTVTQHARNFYNNFPMEAYVIEELLLDHLLIIQKTNGVIYSFGPDNSETKIADSLIDYLFPNDKY